MRFTAFKKPFIVSEGFLIYRRRDKSCLELDNCYFGEIYDLVVKGKWAGYVSLRLGKNSRPLYYLGDIGYRVEPEFRGRHLSLKALKVLKSHFKELGLKRLVITTNVENFASRKICEYLGAKFESIVAVPQDQKYNCAGARYKCRYIWSLED